MIKQIYSSLLSKYGRQNWWPVTPRGELQPFYSGGPKTTDQKFEVIVGAILTQNTAWKNVELALIELNKEQLLKCEKIIKVRRDRLAKLIKSSGYFNQKAIKLKAVCKFLKDTPISTLEEMTIPELRATLLEVKGIGPETADSIILYAFNKPIFVVDAYTKRIFSRLGLCQPDISYEDLQALFHRNLRKNQKMFNEYHALLVKHGKNVCKKKPLCNQCIVCDFCPKKI